MSLLGLIKANRPELAPLFFQTDLSPYILGILRYLSRSECACLANRRTSTDCVLWTVLFSMLATGFVFRATMHLRCMLGGGCYREHSCDIAAPVIKFELILAELALGAAIYTFCSLCLRVLWRGDSKGEHSCTVFYHRNERTEDVDRMFWQRILRVPVFTSLFNMGCMQCIYHGTCGPVRLGLDLLVVARIAAEDDAELQGPS